MDKRIDIYDLNNSYYLHGDMEHTIDKIGDLFEINFYQIKIEFISKIKYPETTFWASDEVTKIFNDQIPTIKSIIKDIYSIIEGIFVAKNGKFDKPRLEIKYPELKILREFNNKLKHHNNKNIIFNIISLANVQSKTLDCIIQYKYENTTQIEIIQLTIFFELFFLILEDENIITIERK
jgi:hypothetical protein